MVGVSREGHSHEGRGAAHSGQARGQSGMRADRQHTECSLREVRTTIEVRHTYKTDYNKHFMVTRVGSSKPNRYGGGASLPATNRPSPSRLAPANRNRRLNSTSSQKWSSRRLLRHKNWIFRPFSRKKKLYSTTPPLKTSALSLKLATSHGSKKKVSRNECWRAIRNQRISKLLNLVSLAVVLSEESRQSGDLTAQNTKRFKACTSTPTHNL